MDELSDDIYNKITELSETINNLIDNNELKKALELSWEGYDLLPDPKTKWEACMWFLVTIGDINFMTGDYKAAYDNLSGSMHCEGAVGNPFIHLRLGQAAFELGKMDKAADELTRAYGIAGKEIFDDQDDKYFEFLKTKIKKPFFKKW